MLGKDRDKRYVQRTVVRQASDPRKNVLPSNVEEVRTMPMLYELRITVAKEEKKNEVRAVCAVSSLLELVSKPPLDLSRQISSYVHPRSLYYCT